MNPFSLMLRRQGVVILDGGLATTLEARGSDLVDPLWSARLLLDEPEAIRAVHTDFLAAGADCISTITYQASLQGFRDRGLSDAEGADLMELAVRLAVEARDTFWGEPANRAGRFKPVVAASIGPYGAFLTDGSEYRGDYDLDEHELLEFHRSRWRLLAESDADVLGCETIPSSREARALLTLLRETPGVWAWLSFSCRDGQHLSDGTPLREMAALCQAEARVAAVGVNCVSPDLVPLLLAEAGRGTTKPLFAYPNSGGLYDAVQKTWAAPPGPHSVELDAAEWLRLGASGIGGCCQVPPDEIRRIRAETLPPIP